MGDSTANATDAIKMSMALGISFATRGTRGEADRRARPSCPSSLRSLERGVLHTGAIENDDTCRPSASPGARRLLPGRWGTVAQAVPEAGGDRGRGHRVVAGDAERAESQAA